MYPEQQGRPPLPLETSALLDTSVQLSGSAGVTLDSLKKGIEQQALSCTVTAVRQRILVAQELQVIVAMIQWKRMASNVLCICFARQACIGGFLVHRRKSEEWSAY